MNIADYHQMTSLSTGARTTIYRAQDEKSGASVILKLLHPENNVPEAVARLRFEYEVASKVAHPCVSRPLKFLDTLGQLGIVFEDIGGMSLRAHMAQRPLGVRHCLAIARQVALALTCLHENSIVHRDVTAQNIVFNATTGRAQLIDLGIASRLQRERSSVDATAVFEGTLAFVSPEQTGRLNRSVDARSDLYSLGCTLYVMLTGDMPFTSQDTLELIHAILARLPSAPRAVMPSVPQVLSDMVMLLLAKSPEDRYQSAAGLLADLDTAMAQLDGQLHIEPFALRTQDHDESFRLAEKLYGREVEVATLAAAFTRMTQEGGNALAMVRGNSGEGKSALVQELQRGMAQHRALYGGGKFDPLNRAIPYSAFNEAFTGLIRQLLRRDSQQVAEIRDRLTGALGKATGVLTSVLPAFELLLGRSETFHRLGPKESENRFLVMFQDAVRAMATRQHPIVLFVDDLQWLDAQSLELIRILATPSLTPYVLLIGAYRRNDVDTNHPLTGLIADLESSGARIERIELGPLRPDDIEAMVADTLLCSAVEAQPLAALLADKTAGNAFFVGEFLRHLHQTDKLHYSRSLHRWTWDISQIRTAGITNNVVELMLRRMHEMPVNSQRALAYAASVGSTFDLNSVAKAMEVTLYEATQYLWPAVGTGVVEPVDETYKYVTADTANTMSSAALYRFVHDKVRQSATDLAAPAERLKMRHTLGILLLRSLSAEQLDARAFDVANHLQAATQLIAPPDAAAARTLLLLAGRRAKAANACRVALSYLASADTLTPENPWETDYAAYHAMQLDLAECEDLTGNTESARCRMDTILQHCKDPVAALQVHQRNMVLMASQNQLDRVIETGLRALREVGVNLPARPNTLQLVRETLRVNRARRGRPITALADAPELTDPLQEGILGVLLAIQEPAFQINPNLFILLALRTAALSLTHGISRFAAMGFAAYGIVLASALNKPSAAADCGRQVSILTERYGNNSRPGASLMILAGLLSHYDAPLAAAVNRAEHAYRSGIESGELDSAFRSACMVVAFQLQHGRPLSSVQARAQDFAQTFALRAELIGREVLLEYRQATRALLGLTQSATSFSDADYHESEHLAVMRGMQAQAPLADYFSLKMQVCFIMGELAAAETFGSENVDFENGLRGIPMLQQYFFCMALTTSELLLRFPDERVKQRRKRLAQLRRKLHWWAEAGPLNFANDLLVVDAQVAQLRGLMQEAAQLYETALRGYEAGSHLNKVAITHELYGRMSQRQNLPHAAEGSMRAAQAHYSLWGAAGKVQALEEEYPQWLKGDTYRDRSTNTQHARTGTQSTTSNTAVTAVDMTAVLNALQLLAAETVIVRLVHGLVRNLVTYVGAERAVLMTLREQALTQVAEVMTADPEDMPPRPEKPLHESTLPLGLIRYVQQTRETQVIDDATSHVDHASGDYFGAHKIKSVLCMPVLHKGEVKGILYAENALVGYAFTRGRVEICRMLALQVAISLENADLYVQLEQKVQARTQELRETQERLVRVEKEATEQQMAGGFAHEMRNTLSAAHNALGAAMGDNVGGPGLDLQLRAVLDQMAFCLQSPQTVSAAEAQQLQTTMVDVSATLSDIMHLTQESVVRALEVTTMIMEYSRLGLTRRGTDAVDVRNVAERIAEEAKAEMFAAQVNLVTRLPATSTFYGTEAHFYSVIRNLVNNARDALLTCNDARVRRIEVDLQREGSMLKLFVRDNAEGMPEQVQKRIFEPFFSTKPETGLGLGLSMVRKLVELYGGSIQVESTIGQGTIFTVTYPLTN